VRASGHGAFASGSDTDATGVRASTFGEGTTSAGDNATSFGQETTANGANSIATGYQTIANGAKSISFGDATTANGHNSFSSGYNTIASPYSSVAIGQYNIDVTGGSYSWVLTDPILMVGNGTASNARNNAFTILKNGNCGINTATPDALTHIIRNNPTNGPYFGNVISIMESDLNSYVQFSNANNKECGFLSGNSNTAIRSALIFSADSAIVFNSGGNSSKMALNKNGFLGIGTLAPAEIFHVRKASSGAIANSGSVGIFESNVSAYLNILTPNANESGLLFGNVALSAHGGIIYNNPSTPNGLQFRTNSNTTRMVIDNTGNVGIGTSSPSEKLHVVGDICYTGSIGACSDIRYKKDLIPIENTLEKILSIGSYSYLWKTDEFPNMEFTGEKQIGVIAQEITDVFPEIVSQDDAGYFRVDYSRLSVLLLAGVKDQQQIIDEQALVIQNQQKEIESLSHRLDAIEYKFHALLSSQNSVTSNK
jgi:hypothetical protein